MEMTLADALSRVRSMLAEPSDAPTKFWDDDEVKQWINEGYTNFCQDTKILRRRAYCEVGAGETEITLPPEAIRIYNVWFEDVDGNLHTLKRSKRDELITASGSSTAPTTYYITRRDVIHLYLAPSEGGKLYVDYAYVPPYLEEDNDEVAVPERFQPAIIHYACYQAMLKQKDLSPKAPSHLAVYQSYVARAIRENTQLVDEPSPSFVPHNYREAFRF